MTGKKLNLYHIGRDAIFRFFTHENSRPSEMQSIASLQKMSPEIHIKLVARLGRNLIVRLSGGVLWQAI